ncbi:MAG: hypothetical protein ACOZAR_03160 [Patescibacteria group bacterium]
MKSIIENSEHTIEKINNPWGETTDPNKHNPEKFRYLVHAFNPASAINMMQMNIIVQEKYSHHIFDKKDGDQSINLFCQPERLTQRVALSCSLIDQNHVATWGRAGIILEADQKNVCISQPKDCGSMVMSKNLLLQQALQKTFYYPDQLLQHCNPHQYNEVVVLANHNNQKIRLAGFFIKVDEDDEPIDEGLASKMSLHAYRLHLPLVKIPEFNDCLVDKIFEQPNSLHLHFKGKTCWLSGSPDNGRLDFHKSGSKGIWTFIHETELENIITFLQKNNFSQKKINVIKQNYLSAREKYFAPTIEYNPDHTIKKITKLSGYGKNERKIEIYPSGVAHWVNLAAERKKVSEIFSSNGRPQIQEERSLYHPLNPQEFDSIIDMLLKDKQNKISHDIIKQWAKDLGPVIAKKWKNEMENKQTLSMLNGRNLELEKKKMLEWIDSLPPDPKRERELIDQIIKSINSNK